MRAGSPSKFGSTGTPKPGPDQARTATDSPSPWPGRVERNAGWISLALVLVATLRIASTYNVFNHTVDEMFHIACGVEWWSRGTYVEEAQHPPLQRILVGFGPWMAGARLMEEKRNLYDQGAYVLYSGEAYDRRLALARAGTLPLFWLSCAVVWLWCIRWLDRLTGVIAMLLYTSIPAILAHAGLATTDMALAAALPAALLAAVVLAESPTMRNGVLFGVALALALLAKFSTLPFFPCALLAAGLFAWRRGLRPGALRPVLLPALAGLAVSGLLVWAAYRFSFSGIPAPEFFSGIGIVRAHNAEGHPSWLLGQFSRTGFWYYYPVALLFKTPAPLLVLIGAGVWMAWKKPDPRIWAPAAFVLGILGFAATSRINIGVRHVLPVYVLLAIVAAAAVRDLLRRLPSPPGLAALALVALSVAAPALAHPDYLSYFNFLGGDNPEEVLVDSDLDWGQDMNRLSARLRQLGARQVAFNPLVTGFWEEAHGFPKIVPLDPRGPRPGWNAVSLTMLKLTRMGTRETHPGMTIWTDRAKPVERVGRGILLYYNPSPR